MARPHISEGEGGGDIALSRQGGLVSFVSEYCDLLGVYVQ